MEGRSRMMPLEGKLILEVPNYYLRRNVINCYIFIENVMRNNGNKLDLGKQIKWG